MSVTQRILAALLALAVLVVFGLRLLVNPAASTPAAATEEEVAVAPDSQSPPTGLQFPAESKAGHPLAEKMPEFKIPVHTALAPSQLSEGLPNDYGHWRGNPVLADLDQDGHLDLVASIRRWERTVPAEGLYVWRGDGQGGWTEWTEGLPRTMGYGGASVGDVDGDGDLEVAFSSHDTPPQVFFHGDDGWSSRSEGIAMPGVSSDVALADFDRDGELELAVLGFFTKKGGLRVFSQGEDGVWALDAEVLEQHHFGAMVEAHDVDGDGFDEIVASTSQGPKVWSFVDGEYVDRSAGLPTPEIGGSDLGIDLHDIDGDGTQELLVSGMIYGGHEPLRLFRWDGAEWSPTGEGLANDEAFFDAEFAQLDGTGPLELVAGGKFGIVLMAMVDVGRFEIIGRLDDTDGLMHLTTGDVNADGIDEIVFVGFGGIRVLDVSRGLEGVQ